MKYVLFFFIVIIFACHKDGGRCERWTYYETCQSKQQGVFCAVASTDTIYSSVCNDDLKEAAPGATVKIFEDASFVKYRHYVRKGN